MLIQPSAHEFHRIQKGIARATSDEYDMEIVNELYNESALVLTHCPYKLLTSKFAKPTTADHSAYLDDNETAWDPEAVFEEAKHLHFRTGRCQRCALSSQVKAHFAYVFSHGL